MSDLAEVRPAPSSRKPVHARQVEFRPARPEDAAQVEAFNRRLAAAGQRYRLSLEKPFRTMAHRDDAPVTAERYLYLEDGEVRGGIGLKRMRFRVNGIMEEVAFSVYPLSEGVANPAFRRIGVAMQAVIHQRFPLTYNLGSPSLKRYFRSFSTPVPFHYAVLRPRPFLRNIAFARRRPAIRLLFDLAALSGAGSLALGLVKLVQRARGRVPDAQRLAINRVHAWGDWADEVWHRAQGHYALIGDRSRAALQSLYPEDNQHLIKLMICARDTGRRLGWAVVTAERLNRHKYFGDMRLGAIVDLLAEPGDAYAVASAALLAVQQAQADLAVVNHSDGRWNAAFERAGMLPWTSNLCLYLSSALKERFEPIQAYVDRFYFTRGDGHGPTSLWMADYHADGTGASAPALDSEEAYGDAGN